MKYEQNLDDFDLNTRPEIWKIINWKKVDERLCTARKLNELQHKKRAKATQKRSLTAPQKNTYEN